MYIIFIALISSSFNRSNGEDGEIIFEFQKNSDIGNWRTLNDGVMGGNSTSLIKINKSGYGIFQGNVSTENNGGFASVRYSCDIKVGSYSSIAFRVKGDGKEYQFRIKNKSSDFESYITSFTTTGKWQTIQINLSDLYPVFRGRELNKENFNFSHFEELSFLIANKKDESFKLFIDKIKFK